MPKKTEEAVHRNLTFCLIGLSVCRSRSLLPNDTAVGCIGGGRRDSPCHRHDGGRRRPPTQPDQKTAPNQQSKCRVSAEPAADDGTQRTQSAAPSASARVTRRRSAQSGIWRWRQHHREPGNQQQRRSPQLGRGSTPTSRPFEQDRQLQRLRCQWPVGALH